MKRRLVNLLAALSLLLCAATVVLWVRSYRIADYLSFKTDDRSIAVTSVAGQIAFMRTQSPYLLARDGFDFRSVPMQRYGRDPWGILGFGRYERHATLFDLYVIDLPHWALDLVTLVLPSAWYHRHWRHWKRMNERSCVRCGYDLRATPDRCPECGTAAPAPQPAEANT
jgi:hypothetical protein